MRELNEDRTRAITDLHGGVMGGYACYEGEVHEEDARGPEFEGDWRGWTEDLDVARAWLRGEEVPIVTGFKQLQ